VSDLDDTDLGIQMIFATSGSGKSTFINEKASGLTKKILGTGLASAQRTLNRSLILDGDDIIQETIGWPSGKWWETMPEDELDEFVERIVTICMSAAHESVVLFGVFPRSEEMFDRCLEGSGLLRDNCIILDIPLEELERNMQSRALDPDRGAKPIDADRSYEGLKDLLALDMMPSANWSDLPELFTDFAQLFRNGELAMYIDKSVSISIVDVVQRGKMIRSIIRIDDDPTIIVHPVTSEIKFGDEGSSISPTLRKVWRRLSRQHRDLRYSMGVAPRTIRGI